jgi:hypothetical protein
VVADLESEAQTISRLLSAKLGSDINRSVNAKEKIFQLRTSFEKRKKSFFGKRRSLLPGDGVRVALAQ